MRVLRAAASTNPTSGSSYLPNGADDDDRCVCGGKKKRGYWAGYRDDEEFSDEDEEDEQYGKRLAKALKGKGGTFSEREVRRALMGLGRDGRMRL